MARRNRIKTAIVAAALGFSFVFTAASGALADSESTSSSAVPNGEFELTISDGDALSGLVQQVQDQIGTEGTTQLLEQIVRQERQGVDTGIPGMNAQTAAALEKEYFDEILNVSEDPIDAGTSLYARSGYRIDGLPINGGSINNKRTWSMHSTSEHVKCSALGLINCKVTDRRNTRIRIDPGKNADRVEFNQTYFPTTGKIKEPTFSITSYKSKKVSGNIRSQIGVGASTRYISHEDMRGGQFVFEVSGNIVSAGKYKTLSSVRTKFGHCTTAFTPTCTFN